MSTFVGHSTRTGPSRTTFVQQQRKLYENPEARAFDFYRRPVSAIRGGRASGRDREAMAALVAQATKRSKPHYEAVAAGWLQYLGRRKPVVIGVGQARWRHGDLEVKISPHLGLQETNGQSYAVYLYCKDVPLTSEGALSALGLMHATMTSLLPGGAPLVIDVRRHKHFKLGKRDELRVGAWLQSEAAAFMTLWEAAAA